MAYQNVQIRIVWIILEDPPFLVTPHTVFSLLFLELARVDELLQIVEGFIRIFSLIEKIRVNRLFYMEAPSGTKNESP
jgi:hypothetical protein